MISFLKQLVNNFESYPLRYLASGAATFVLGVMVTYLASGYGNQKLFLAGVIIVGFGILISLPAFIGIWSRRLKSFFER